MANAKNWFDEERIDWITNRYSKPDLKFYENPVTVDNNSDEIYDLTDNLNNGIVYGGSLYSDNVPEFL